MTRIALILTGGTICSAADARGERQTNASAAVSCLEDAFLHAHPQENVVFERFFPYDTLSENLTPQHWKILLKTLMMLDFALYDGIIIAHGTDTLAMTAGFLTAALAGISIPVLLVSANAPLTIPAGNGHANFAAAVSLISAHLRPSVWAVYRNSDGVSYLHHGSRLRQCENFSEDFFSMGMQSVDAALSATPIKLDEDTSISSVLSCTSPNWDVLEKQMVLLIQGYVGLDYSRIPLADICCIIHGTYHSETANALENSPYSLHTLLVRCQQHGIFLGLAPCSRSSQTYASGGDLVRAGIIPLGDIPVTFAYGAAICALMLGKQGDAIRTFIQKLADDCASISFRCCI